MKPKTFSEIYSEAERHEDYWIAGAILEFTESVVREMKRQSVTRTHLAERLGTTPAYVTKILRGRVNFTLATMARLARALDSELQVRLSGVSRREEMPTAREGSRASTVRAGRTGKVAATATRPAALRRRPKVRRKPRQAAAPRTFTR
jgi:transcriptional regulator with XRE-family HTH domain